MTEPTTGPAKLRGLALRTLFPGFAGTDSPPDRLMELVDEGLGGVVLFGRNVDPVRADAGVAALTARLRAGRPDLIVAIDEEGGDLTRLDAATGSAYPGSAALGAADDPDLTREVASELAARLRACGITVNFAPVADVDTDPRNPVIGVRAFGAEPDLVARHSAAFVAGQQAMGVAATVKHFPGHGGTAEDSHVTVPVLDASLATLERRELVPFRAAIAAGTRVVMTAHILVPELDPDNTATLSTAVITGLLRNRMGFDGLVMTDGLDMSAISGTVGHAEGAVRSLIAGVDAICFGGDSVHPELVDEVADAVVEAAQAGRLAYERLVEAAGRVRALARWTGAAGQSNGQAKGQADGAPAADSGRVPARMRAARRAVTARGAVALPAAALVLELQDEPSLAAGFVPWGVGAPLTARMPGTVVVPVHEAAPSVRTVLDRYGDRPVVIAVRGVRRRPWQLGVVAEVRARRPDAVVVDHELSEQGQFAEPYVLTYGAARVTAEAAADLLATRSSPHLAVDHASMGRHVELSSSSDEPDGRRPNRTSLA